MAGALIAVAKPLASQRFSFSLRQSLPEGSLWYNAEKDMTVQTQDTGKAVSSVIAQSWHRCSKFMQRETRQTPHRAGA